MSTLAVNSITDANAGNTATINGATPTVYNTVGKNLIINGGMQIAQRGTSSTSIFNGIYPTADRWHILNVGNDSFTYSVSTDAPTGFSSSFKVQVETAYTTASTDLKCINQKFEGQNLQHLKKGTSDAVQLTASFWVKSNTTGNIVVELLDRDSAFRHICKLVNISTADTWEYKTITFEGDTTGALDNDNNASLDISFYYSVGSDYTSGTLATSWASYVAANRAAGISLASGDFGSSTNNYFAITGVQLEVGSVATPFERRPYGTELSLCQRYYYRITGNNFETMALGYTSTICLGNTVFPVTMRIAPTALEQSGTVGEYVAFSDAAVNASTAPTFERASTSYAQTRITVASGLTGGKAYMHRIISPSYYGWSAEL